MSTLLLTIVFFGVAIAVFAAFCAFSFKCFEFFFETPWARSVGVFFATILCLLGYIVSAFTTKEKPKYRFNHTTGQPELISEGWGFSQKFGVFMAFFWFGFIGFVFVSFFR